ncbi:hypothetical protein CBI38_32550 (plasmid) [Rhodococcus oxybenzonivorans]|uniref:Uncharacterized protein n=1 Tax=Rhodococcus oxybenzonivorans TaxID=1990687 RepID=A0A2S2C5P0_9NOCA|nr:hypothetical protein CBI38_32550 [Rhodococcus oxybenzonivorans]
MPYRQRSSGSRRPPRSEKQGFDPVHATFRPDGATSSVMHGASPRDPNSDFAFGVTTYGGIASGDAPGITEVQTGGGIDE